MPVDGGPEGDLQLGAPTIEYSLDVRDGRARTGVPVILQKHIAHG